jgi:hypothetical protein
MFQIALAAGAPLGRAAWGGTHPGQLPVGLRVGSAIAVGVWVLAALIVLGRAGVTPTPLPPMFLLWGTWILVVVTLIGALMNRASPSPWERYLWAPFTRLLAGLCLVVARTSPAQGADQTARRKHPVASGPRRLSTWAIMPPRWPGARLDGQHREQQVRGVGTATRYR